MSISHDHEQPPQFGRVPYDVVTSGILARMKPADLRVYLALCAHANQQWQTWVGSRSIREITGLTAGGVSLAIQRLRDLGMIETNERRRGQGYTYTITTALQP